MAVLGADVVHTGDAVSPDLFVDETLHADPRRAGRGGHPHRGRPGVGAGRRGRRAAGCRSPPAAPAPVSPAPASPSRAGILVSFERMAALLELDEANQVAVVQPGLTLAELDARTAEVGLVYPVFPGTLAASLGGNVATNAGGMRAVKYGVTRHQVLGPGGRHRHRRGHPLRWAVREEHERLRPHPADHRVGGHPRPRHRSDPEAPPPAHPHRVHPRPLRRPSTRSPRWCRASSPRACSR